MKEYIIELSELVNPPHTDLISGRDDGELFAKKKAVLKHIKDKEKIVLIINETIIKGINDSFIKGFFKDIFEKYRSYAIIKDFIEIRASVNFKSQFEKNFKLLENIYNG